MAALRKFKWIIVAVVAVILAAGAYLGSDSAAVFGQHATLKRDKAEGQLVLESDRYAVAFSADNGSIAYVRDKRTKSDLSLGNRDRSLWWSFLDDDTAVSAAKAEPFAYDWHKRKSELVFHYGGKVKVDATVRFDGDDRLVLSAKVANGAEQTLKSFRFPYELKADVASVQDGLLPMLPGARLKDAFFKDNGSYDAQYPGVMFAAYAALRTSGGALALYDVHDGALATVNVGFKSQVNDPGKTAIVHDFDTAIAPGAEWKTPDIVLQLGGDYADSIASYGEKNGIRDAESLQKKLGKKLDQYAALPFYKTDISALKDASWDALQSRYVANLDYPGVLHLVGFQTGGHDENYPNFMPPDAKWGGDAAFQSFVKDAHAKGNLVIPYTNFSWWGVHSPTLGALPDGAKLEDIAVAQKNGEPIKEDYGEHSGYVVDMSHPFVTGRIAEERKKLQAAGFDGIFEDQWGIRNAPYDYGKAAPKGTDPSNAYFEGVRSYFDSLSGNHMYTEDGIDVLAGDSVGFMGTNLLWDKLGYRPKTATYTDYYPMIGILARDKVLLYQHDLAAETMTDNQDMLRWNAAMGYNLSADLYNGADNPWVDLVGVFQREVLAKYADARVTGFAQLTPTVTRTEFGGGEFAVTANWDAKEPYALDGDTDTTLAPGGFLIASRDGSIRAGNLVRYNGADLDPGEHDLIEVRGKDAIRVYQPFGTDATVRVKNGDKWPHAIAAAYGAGGEKIAELPVKEDGGYVSVDFIATIKDKKVAYVELTRSKDASPVTGTPYEKVKLQTNIALGKEVRSTTDAATDFAAKKAVDGDPYTYWESMKDKFPQAITLDLGEEREVKRIVLRLPPQDAWEKRDQTVEVQGGTDGDTFATLVASQPYTFDPASENKVEIALDAAAGAKLRYIRLVIGGNTAWPAAQFSEFEVY